jgi:hypothetical protein
MRQDYGCKTDNNIDVLWMLDFYRYIENLLVLETLGKPIQIKNQIMRRTMNIDRTTGWFMLIAGTGGVVLATAYQEALAEVYQMIPILLLIVSFGCVLVAWSMFSFDKSKSVNPFKTK